MVHGVDHGNHDFIICTMDIILIHVLRLAPGARCQRSAHPGTAGRPLRQDQGQGMKRFHKNGGIHPEIYPLVI